MKCERCGNDEVWQEGRKLTDAQGADSTQTLRYKNAIGSITASVCNGCANMLRKLGWR